MTTMTTTTPKLLTAADLLHFHSKGIRGELVQGVLHQTMPAGLRHGKIAMLLGARLVSHVEPAGLGHVFGSDTGVLLERNPDTVREPDVAFVSAARLPLDADITGYCPVVPDLVVEIVSPTDTEAAVDEKATMWLEHGARMALVINPETRRIRVRQSGRATIVLTPADTLDGGDVLPGFTCPVAEILGR